VETPLTNAASDHHFIQSEANKRVVPMPKMSGSTNPPEKRTLQNQRYSKGEVGILPFHGNWTENFSEINLPA
jgi:hypothetical protein